MTNRIRELREEHGWSQQQLATHAGLSVSAVSEAERNYRGPRGDRRVKPRRATLEAIANAFGKQLEEVWSDEDEELSAEASGPPG